MTVLSANAQIGLPEDFTSADLAMFTDAEVAAMRADPDFGIPAEDPATQVTQEADPVDPALSADQQAAIDAFPGEKMRAFDIDGGAVRSRMILDKMERAQQAAAAE